MGGGGFLGLGPAPSAPAAPDYAGAAKETAEGNLDAARAAAAANRVNQVTPYGNLNYTQSGTDSYGNPTWTATTTLSDTGQQLLNNQNAVSLGLGSAITSQLGQVQDVMGRGFNPNTPAIQYGGQGPQLGQVGKGPQFQSLGSANPMARAGNTDALQRSLGQNVGMEGWDRASNLLMQRLDPQLERQQERQDAQLAARKAKDKSASLLTTLLAEVVKIGIDDGKRDTTDDEAKRTVKKSGRQNRPKQFTAC
jgi:hypothetical protein